MPVRSLTLISTVGLAGVALYAATCLAQDHIPETKAFIAESSVQVQEAKADYFKNAGGDDPMPTLEIYEDRVKRGLESGFLLWRKINGESPADPALTLLEPYLNILANQYMDVAYEFAHQGAIAAGLAIAHQILSKYDDIPLPKAVMRADDYIYEYDSDYRP